MNVSRFVVVLLLVMGSAAARLPAQGQGGRGGPPPQVVDKATPEIMNEDPQTEQRSQDRVGFPAHKIVGNLYYIGTVTLSSYLITTPQGNIVINSDYEETLPLMKKAIESLGFKMEDTKILLASHAHPDHQMGDAAFKQMTGAQTMFMAEDVPALQNMKAGGKEHPIDKILHDGDKVELGLAPIGSIGMGVFALLLSYAGHSFALAAACLTMVGFFGGLFAVPLNALLQQKAGDEEKGRIMATNNVLNTVTPYGDCTLIRMANLHANVLQIFPVPGNRPA